jgi:hypothetical protein
MSDANPGQGLPEVPAEPLYTHPASPFLRTEPGYAPPPVDQAPVPAAQSTWVMYRSQILFGLSMLAYLMVLVGSVTVLKASGDAPWRYYVAVLPVVPAVIVIIQFMRALRHLDELQKRIQTQAFGFSLGLTALVTFTYGFLEGVGLPHLNWTYVLPMMAVFWGLGTAFFTIRYR